MEKQEFDNFAAKVKKIVDYFGHQRTVRGRSDNPSAQQFGYNDLTIGAIAPLVSGNTGVRYGKEKWGHISEDPVKKR